MVEIKNVTVICIDCYNYAGAAAALKKTLEQISPYKAIFLTDIDIEIEGVEVKQIPSIYTKEQYSEFCLKKLRHYFYTTHCLLIQHDGYVLDGNAWDNEFLKYDYIGAPWLYPDRNVGNGGFSLRSHRLQMLMANDDFIKSSHPEDEVIGRLYRDYLEKKFNVKFAPQELAEKFSYELREPICSTFGFHGHFHKPFMPVAIIKRTGAMGDLIMAEPIIDYYHNKGFRVYLDTMIDNMNLFFNHPYRVYHVSELNKSISPSKMVNLDMVYEFFPKENVLDSYYKFCGISDGERRNSRLFVQKNSFNWLFDKYVVFHVDDTNMPHRNINGINFKIVEDYLKGLGYNIIQVGVTKSRFSIGTKMHTETKQMLMYLLAGAEFVVGIDSGVTQLAVALGKKTIIFTGSVNLKLRYQDFSNIEVIKSPCREVKNDYCYHNSVLSVTGTDCIYDKENPPCTQFNEIELITAINKITC